MLTGTRITIEIKEAKLPRGHPKIAKTQNLMMIQPSAITIHIKSVRVFGEVVEKNSISIDCPSGDEEQLTTHI